ncbi:Serine/threonine-protein kinase PK-1 [Acaryochloris thomasi RCC1774]|uniref:Serine/threonine-protein kinase PK-1 n=1 Tax=Acaryochloris thomasi RCC1774 TaxID=1764569 RepID=A0A2W1JRV2_9CYAN|nr:serine/threonine-protein kinase [Acaryochloris thomasi]PZD72734.1 Serine/threonine-protein kinase PK-1 [Acaryochloris thomasi RCC1774]
MSSALTPDVFLTGTTLQQGKYRLDSILSQSDSLIIYRATHRCLDKTVTIQTLRNRPELNPNQPRIVQRFISAAQRAAQASHPHLIHINDLFVELELPFLVMDHLVGESLGELTAKHSFSEEKAVEYIFQVAPALSALHRQNCLHGSLQPEHLLLQAADNRIVLTDLGLEKSLMSGSLNSGSAGYIAPEQYSSNQGLSPATDVYALAATFYTLLTGHRPVCATSRQQTSLPSPRQFYPQLSHASEQAVFTGMALRASERPQSIEQWLALLRPMPPSKPPKIKATVTHLQKTTQLQGASTAKPSSAPLKPHRQVPNATAEAEVAASLLVPPSTPLKDMSTRSKPLTHPNHPKFPTRFLWLTSAIAGVMGLGFGFVLRFNYLSQFSAPQAVSPKSTKVQKESFPPRPKAESSDLNPTNNAVGNLAPEPGPRPQDFANVEEPVKRENITGTAGRQTLRSSQPAPRDSIVESEIGEIPHELTPAGLAIPQEDNSPALSDWADIVPSQSAYQTTSPVDEEADRPAEVSPLPEDFDLSDAPDREFLTPQI